MELDLWRLVDIVALPVIGGIIAWIFKLDARIYQLNSGMLTREEFIEEMRALRTEIHELRKAVKSA